MVVCGGFKKRYGFIDVKKRIEFQPWSQEGRL